MIILGFLLISYLISHFRNIAYDALQNLFFREKDRIVVLDDLPFFFFCEEEDDFIDTAILQKNPENERNYT